MIFILDCQTHKHTHTHTLEHTHTHTHGLVHTHTPFVSTITHNLILRNWFYIKIGSRGVMKTAAIFSCDRDNCRPSTLTSWKVQHVNIDNWKSAAGWLLTFALLLKRAACRRYILHFSWNLLYVFLKDSTSTAEKCSSWHRLVEKCNCCNWQSKMTVGKVQPSTSTSEKGSC